MKRTLTLLTFLLLLASCHSFKHPELVGIDNGRVETITAGGAILDFDIHYFNPNKSKLQLKHAEGDAWMDDKKLGHFVVDTLIHIPANSDFALPIRLTVDMNFILKNAMAGFTNKEVSVRIEGIARVGKSGIFIHYPIHYEGKQNVSELLKLANNKGSR
jgi:LEA14-like dessication related protein